MQRLLLLCLVPLSLFATTHLIGESGPKIPLDLPSGGGGLSEDEEDSPEIITFFGSSYEGEGFYFLLDKSGSMQGEKMDLLKAELTSTLNSLSSESHFGMVAFSDNVVPFSTYPMVATPVWKSQAVAWVQALVPAGSTHMLAGATSILDVAQLHQSSNRVIIAVGDGLPNQPSAPQTLEGIIFANWQGLPFNTILFGNDPAAVQFMQDLAAATGGTFQSNPE